MSTIDNKIAALLVERDAIRSRMKEIARELKALRVQKSRAQARLPQTIDEFFDALD